MGSNSFQFFFPVIFKFSLVISLVSALCTRNRKSLECFLEKNSQGILGVQGHIESEID